MRGPGRTSLGGPGGSLSLGVACHISAELAQGLKEGMLTALWGLFCVPSLFASHRRRLGTSVFLTCQVPHAMPGPVPRRGFVKAQQGTSNQPNSLGGFCSVCLGAGMRAE